MSDTANKNNPWVLARETTLDKCPEGLFMSMRDGSYSLGFKSEYTASNGLVEAYCFTTGEMFWGGAKTVDEQRNLLVYPLADLHVVEEHVIAEILRTMNTDNLKKTGTLPMVIHNYQEAIQFVRDAKRNTIYCWTKPDTSNDNMVVSCIFTIVVTDQLRVYTLNHTTDDSAAGLAEIPLGILADNLVGATVDYAGIG